jgi:uncharacterized membrane protein YkgB
MRNLEDIGMFISRYGIVFILLAFGMFKFTNTEAQTIKPLIDNSPLLNWTNKLFSIRMISSIIGIIEIITALGLSARFFSAKIAFLGSVLGCVTFLITLTFLFTTPGLITKTDGFWLPDGFIIKDLVLFGFCLWSAGESYRALISNAVI